MTGKFLLQGLAAAVIAAYAAGAAAQVFTIRDIRVEGIQRTEPGTERATRRRTPKPARRSGDEEAGNAERKMTNPFRETHPHPHLHG